MRSRSRALLLTVGLILLAFPLPAQAAETSNSEFVIIRSEDVLEDDLYAGAIKVSVDGTIQGDLIAFAGEEVVINGTVTGSVFAVAPDVRVNGEIGGSLRVSAGTVEIEGTVGRDVVATAYRLDLGEPSVVEGEVIAWVVSMTARGQIASDLSGSQRSLDLAGAVGGDVDVTVSQLTVAGTLNVGGDLGYRSSNDAEGLDMAEVGGAVVHKEPLPPNIRVRALGLFGRFLVIVFLTAVALAVAWGWPGRTRRAIDNAGGAPFKSWGTGAMVLLAPILLTAVSALIVGLAPASAAYPMLAVLVPLVLATFGLVGAVCVVAGVPAVGLLGRTMFSKLGANGAVLAGSAVVGLVWLVPIVGWFVPLAVLPMGLGAWVRTWGGMDSAEAESGAEPPDAADGPGASVEDHQSLVE